MTVSYSEADDFDEYPRSGVTHPRYSERVVQYSRIQDTEDSTNDSCVVSTRVVDLVTGIHGFITPRSSVCSGLIEWPEVA